jgi:peptide-methionine (S)-S-oxide reductase
VDFDPAVVSYEQLLAAFFSSHNAAAPPYSIQYRSAIFFTSEQQEKLAGETKQREETRLGQKLYTAIEPYTSFTIAEDYHQKYYLQLRSDIVNELLSVYPDPADFRDSTAAARINGYVGGYGDPDSLKKNLDKIGLSQSGQQALLQIAESGLSAVCPVIPPES